MGLFDSKKTREEKDMYQKLVVLKDSSYELKNLLHKTVQEFLKSSQKEKLISVYEYTQEIMKRQDILGAFNLKNMGQCYDFVASHYNGYVIKKERNRVVEPDFMSFLENTISDKLLEHKTKQEIDKSAQEIENFAADIEGRLQMMYNSPTQQRLDEIASREAKKFASEMRQQEFEKKFPQYSKIRHAVTLNELGMGGNNPIVSAIKEAITLGKEKMGIPNLEFNDFIMPYLDEKYKLGILTQDEEKIYYKTTTSSNEIEATKRLLALHVNANIFYNTKKERDDFMNSFKETIKIINDLSRDTKGPKR